MAFEGMCGFFGAVVSPGAFGLRPCMEAVMCKGLYQHWQFPLMQHVAACQVAQAKGTLQMDKMILEKAGSSPSTQAYFKIFKPKFNSKDSEQV